MSRVLLFTLFLGALGCRQQSTAPPSFEKIGESSNMQGKFIFAWIDPAKSNDIETIKQAAQAMEQPPGSPCVIIFWSDRSKIPTPYPAAEQEATEVGRYIRRVDGSRRYLPKQGEPVPIR